MPTTTMTISDIYLYMCVYVCVCVCVCVHVFNHSRNFNLSEYLAEHVSYFPSTKDSLWDRYIGCWEADYYLMSYYTNSSIFSKRELLVLN